jgi:hypothetical protein
MKAEDPANTNASNSRPFGSIRGLVLRKYDKHKSDSYTRLGVFEFDHHYSEASEQADATTLWNDRLREYHKFTSWMVTGEIETFALV